MRFIYLAGVILACVSKLSVAQPSSVVKRVEVIDSSIVHADYDAVHYESEMEAAKHVEIKDGSLRDNIARLSALLGIKQVVWSGIGDCIDWSVDGGYKIYSDEITVVFSSLLERFPLSSVYWSTNSVLEIKSSIHLKGCDK